MTRAAIPLLSLALVAIVTGANRKSTADAAPLPARHALVASGTITRLLGATVTAAAAPATEDARAVTRRRLAHGGAGTYIGDILAERDSSIARWPDRSMEPLTVWIQPRSNVADFDAEYTTRVREAFEAWGSIRLPVRFSFVPDSASAEVHVTWIDHFTQPISGRTRWSRDDDWVITDANIVLALHHQDGELLDHDSMHAMALHEIGHLLGLDHTQDTLSVMAPRVRVRALSEADRATARLVYSLPAGPVR
jgi:hypothetical protein